MTHVDDAPPPPLTRPTPEELADMRRSALEQLRPHTLPADAPGAWIRRAIDEEREGA